MRSAAAQMKEESGDHLLTNPQFEMFANHGQDMSDAASNNVEALKIVEHCAVVERVSNQVTKQQLF